MASEVVEQGPDSWVIYFSLDQEEECYLPCWTTAYRVWRCAFMEDGDLAWTTG